MEDGIRPYAFHDLAGRIYADQRLSPGTREVALAMAWLASDGVTAENDPRSDAFWQRLTEMLGPGDYRGSRTGALLAEDAPRYVPPRQVRVNGGACVGPRTRPYRRRNRPSADTDCMVYVPPGYTEPPRPDDRVCGANATIKVIEYDPLTGWPRAHWFCRRHADRAGEVRAQLAAAGPPPQPVPNNGGLLPCYFDADWATVYARYRPGWRPPYHGIRADEWPTPDLRHIPRPPRLTLVSR